MQLPLLFEVPSIDEGRLGRSLSLRAERVGHGQYRFTGGSEPHWVDLYTAAQPRCDCADHLWRENMCKHILAALIREGDERVVLAVGSLVAELLRQQDQRAAA